jgi:RHS repeat-associated protein
MMITRYEFSISILALLLVITTGLYAQDDISIQEEIAGKVEVSAPGNIVLKDGFKALEGSDFRAYIGPRQPQPGTVTVSSPTSSATPATGTAASNYIKTITYREAATTVPSVSFKHLQTMQYFDGLGRPVQTIGVGVSPTGYDVIQPILYDNFGRESIKPLPYTDNSKSGNFRSSVTESTVNDYYNTPATTPAGVESDSRAYTQIGFESSPLNRPVTQTGPGSAWSAKPATIHYLSNDEAKDSWSVDEAGTFTAITYAKDSLYVTETIDEQGNTTREYKDKQGQVVMKESKLGVNWLRTAYIYDDFGLLRCVVPPEASDPGTDTELCYYYKYDGRSRMIEKRVPGGGTTTMVYDTRDRLRFSQNSLQKANYQWSFIKYDELNRPVVTGIFSTTLAIDDFLSSNTGTLNESRNNTSAYYGYTNTSLPTSSQYIVYTVTWYDDYNFIAGVSLNDSLRSTTYDAAPYDFHTKTDLNPRGRITGTMVQMLLPYAGNSNLYSTTWYDKYGNLLRNVSENHLKGKDVASNLYEDITFQVLRSKQEHYKGAERITLEKTFEYDHTGRLLATRQKVTDLAKATSQPEITESAMRYNEIGKMITKYLHSEQVSGARTFLQKENFGYNLRGWLTRINDPALSSGENDLFGMQLFYNSTDGMGSLAPTAGLYNGNIVGMKWSIKNDLTRGYAFTYDGLNRLKTASYADGSTLNSHAGYFDETIPEYDNNGNIKSLKRKYDNTLVDDLTYSYNSKSNKLLQVTDNGTPSNAVEDYPGTSLNYGYDANGNMSTDGSRNTTLYYIPTLNLPQTVDFGNNNRINYYYMADGTKFAKQVWTGASNRITHYIGNIVYEDGRLSYIITREGRLVATGDGTSRTFVPEYSLKDHLGNTRVTFSSKTVGGSIVVEQTSNYYPFGLTMNQYNGALLNYPKNKYLYNGKELQDDKLNGTFFGLIDYGARFYDPQIGRWHSLDPLADSMRRFSPYCYVFNNPLRFIDIDGMAPGDTFATMNEAATDFGKFYNGQSIYAGKEYGSSMYTVVKKDGKTYYVYTEANEGKEASVTTSKAPEGTKTVADLHTHGKCLDTNSKNPADDSFSIGIMGDKGDIDIYNDKGIIGYVATPNGTLLKYDPKKPNSQAIVSRKLPSDPNDPTRVNTITPRPFTYSRTLEEAMGRNPSPNPLGIISVFP